MDDVPNPALLGVACHCGAQVWVVSAAHPDRERAKFNDVFGRVAPARIGDDVAVSEWVCSSGHQLGVSFDAGQLDLGIVKDPLAEPPRSLVTGKWLAGLDVEQERADIAAGGREFANTLFRCPGCHEWRVEPLNAIHRHLLFTAAAPKCWFCRAMYSRNDLHIFMEEFTGIYPNVGSLPVVTGYIDPAVAAGAGADYPPPACSGCGALDFDPCPADCPEPRDPPLPPAAR